MNFVKVPFSEVLADQQAMSAAGGSINLPADIRNKPMFVFPNYASYALYLELQQKSAGHGTLK